MYCLICKRNYKNEFKLNEYNKNRIVRINSGYCTHCKPFLVFDIIKHHIEDKNVTESKGVIAVIIYDKIYQSLNDIMNAPHYFNGNEWEIDKKMLKK